MMEKDNAKTKTPSLKTNAVYNGIKKSCSIVFPLVSFPYISHILGSDGLGKYSFANSITGYFSLMAALGINTYAIREGAKIRDKNEQLSDFCNQLFSINVFSTLISLCLLASATVFNSKINLYHSFIAVQSCAIILNTIGTDWINSIFEDYRYITIRYIIIQFLSLILVFAFVNKPQDTIKYCIIYVFSSAGGNLLNVFYVRKYVKVRFTFHVKLGEHIKPLIILFINTIAVSIYVSSDITMLGFYYNDSTVGIYSFASKIYSIIKQLVNAMIIVALPRIAYVLKNSPKEYGVYMNKIFQVLSIILLPVSVGLFCTSGEIIKIVGGNQYTDGINVLRVLCVALVFALYAALFTNCVLIVNEGEDKCLIATSISAVINVLANLVLLPAIGIIGAAITTVLAEFVNLVIQVLFSKRFLDYRLFGYKSVFSCIIGCIGVAGCCVGLKYVFDNVIVYVIVSVVSATFIYLSCLISLENQIAIEMLDKGLKKLRL